MVGNVSVQGWCRESLFNSIVIEKIFSCKIFGRIQLVLGDSV